MARFTGIDWLLRRLDYEIGFGRIIRGRRSSHFPRHITTEPCARRYSRNRRKFASPSPMDVLTSVIYAPRPIVIQQRLRRRRRHHRRTYFRRCWNNYYLSISLRVKMTISQHNTVANSYFKAGRLKNSYNNFNG